MKTNITNNDRIIRLVIVAVLVALYSTGIISGAAALVFILASFILVLADAITLCLLSLEMRVNMFLRKLHIH